MQKDKLNNLFNNKYNLSEKADNEVLFSNRQIMFEQYKLLVESSHKIEERRSGSNNVFLSINTLLSSLLVRPSSLSQAQEKDLIVLILLTLIGILISRNWLKVIDSYKKLNTVNYLLIEKFEHFFPAKVFSLRAELEDFKEENKKANVVLMRESLLPEVFILFYIIYLIFILYFIIF